MTLPYERFVVPPRLAFEPLEPVGLGTWRVEQLSSLLVRHAANALLPVGAIIAKLIKPACNLASTSEKFCGDGSFYLINGKGTVAREWANVLETLTCRSDWIRLTLANWGVVFPECSLVSAPFKRWCPHCLQEAYERDGVVYEQLIWTVNVVDLCPEHLVPLEHRCSQCGSDQLGVIGKRYLVGFCPACITWLGRGVPVSEVRSADPGFLMKKWIAQGFARLFDHEETHQKRLCPNAFSKMIDAGIRIVFDGNASEFARHIQRNKSVVSTWRSKKVLPSVEAICEVSYAFQIPLECLLTGDETAWQFCTLQNLPYDIRRTLIKRKTACSRNWEKYESFLSSIVNGETGWIHTLDEAAKILKIDVGSLRRRFPVLVREVAKVCCIRRNARAQLARQEKSRKLLDSAHEAISIIHTLGRKPTRRRIIAEMEKFGTRVSRKFHPLIRQAQKTPAKQGGI